MLVTIATRIFAMPADAKIDRARIIDDYICSAGILAGNPISQCLIISNKFKLNNVAYTMQSETNRVLILWMFKRYSMSKIIINVKNEDNDKASSKCKVSAVNKTWIAVSMNGFSMYRVSM